LLWCACEGMRVESPREGQRLPQGQDLVVKFSLSAREGSCRVTVLVNSKAVGSLWACSGSVLVSEHELQLGRNKVEVMDQEEKDPDESVEFDVVPVVPWRERSTCKPHEDDCLHAVNGTCVITRDAEMGRMGRIPRIFHWVWVGYHRWGGRREVPDKFHAYMDTWKQLHPQWQFVVWTDDMITWPLHNQALVNQADTFAELSDIVRLEVVERFGGIYIDTDFEALKPIDDLIASLSFFVGAEKDMEIEVWGNGVGDIWVCPSLFGATANNDVIRTLIDGLPAQVAENLGQDPNHKTGPYFWTNTYAGALACMSAEEGACELDDAVEMANQDLRGRASKVLFEELKAGRAVVFTREFFYPYGWWEMDKGSNRNFGNAFAVHHWQKNWGGGWNK